MGFPRVRPARVVAYIDHNVYQVDSRNSDDHRYLQTASRRYGAWFSKPGNGICHQVHFETFSVPGRDRCSAPTATRRSAASTGMLAIGAGGLDVAVAMGGGPYYFLTMPRGRAVWLTGALRPWVTAKDVILELLRRLHGARGQRASIFEYGGPGRGDALAARSGRPSATWAPSSALTTSVFPSDEATRDVLPRSSGARRTGGRSAPDPDAEYDDQIELDLERDRAAGRAARLARPRGAGLRGRRARRSSRSWSAPAPTARGRTCRR